jgi:hypothetical protein
MSENEINRKEIVDESHQVQDAEREEVKEGEEN